jgi:16S rRNA (uracil1498-N3)-methyltransferase
VSKSVKEERWNKIALAAMKQSLLSYLPKLVYLTLDEISKRRADKIIFEQNSQKYFNQFKPELNKESCFVFGPEGGFDKRELLMFDEKNFYKLADNRLRSETAVIKCASYLNNFFR